MEFEFDPEKSRGNLEKHGIDFETAQCLWLDERRITFDTPFQDEKRSGIIAAYRERLWCAIYTIRNQNIRIISVRRARENEESIYFQF
ncbi:MAG: BrnT family toxin [Verrucomicrobiota bacterium]